MPRAKKKAVAKVEKQAVAQLVGSGRKQAHQSNSMPATTKARQGAKGGGMARAMGEVAGEMEKNAAAYTASLYDPWRGPARVPDILSYPTAVTATTYTVGASVDPAAYVSSQFYFSPTLVNAGTAANAKGWNRRNAAVGTPTVYGSWGQNLDPNTGTVPALFYRTTSFGVRVRNIGAFLNRGGTIRMGRCVTIGQLSATVGDTSRDPRTFAYSLTDKNLEGLKIVWLPYDYESTLEFIIPLDPTEKGGVFFEVTPGGAEVVTLEFEVWHNYEYVPTVGFSSVVEASTCVGSESSFATVATAVERAAGYVGGALSPEMGARITDLAAQYIGGKMYTWFGGGKGGGPMSVSVPNGYFERASVAYQTAIRIARRKGLSAEEIEGLVGPHSPIVTTLSSSSGDPGATVVDQDEPGSPAPSAGWASLASGGRPAGAQAPRAARSSRG